jgi:hypothetical protein
MSLTHTEVIDSFILIGLLVFPGYLVYWVAYHRRRERRRRLWMLAPALLAWCAATYFCFIRLMLWCMGGNCADKVSPFLEFSILYAVSSAGLVSLMHWGRARAPATRSPVTEGSGRHA